jgi:hypothetical protein
MALNASYGATRFWLGINGQFAGYLETFSAPAAKVEDIKFSAGPDSVQFRSHGNLSYGDCKAKYAFSQTGPLYDIVNALIQKNAVEFQARVDIGDHNYKSKRAVDMVDCLVKEIQFDNVDVKDGKALFSTTMTWACSSAKYLVGDSKVGQAASKNEGKRLLKSNYRCTLPGGLDPKGVTKFELPKITVKHGKEGRSDEREELLHFTGWDLSSPKSTHSSIDYKAVTDYVKKILLDGAITPNEWMPGSLTLLGHDMKAEHATFNFAGMCIHEFNWADGELKAGGGDTMATCSLTWQIEGFQLDQGLKD